MKKVLLVTALLLSVVAYGQQRNIKTENYEPSIDYGYDIYFNNGTYHYYYDDNDIKVLHGNKKGGGQKSLTLGYDKYYFTYSEDANYKDGLIDGPLTVSLEVSGGKEYVVYSVSGNYKNGKRDGVWIIKYNDRSGHLYWTYKYSDGELISLTLDCASPKIKDNSSFTKEGGLWSFKRGGIIVQKGVRIDKFIGKNGDRRSLDGEQNKILEDVIKNNGKYDRDSLLKCGYTLISQSTEYGCYICEEDISPFSSAINWSNIKGSPRCGDFELKVEYLELARVHVATWDDVKILCDKYRDPEEALEYGRFRTTESVNTVYVTSDLKEKGLKYLEELRIAEEKAAEEKRMKEEKDWKDAQASLVNKLLDRSLIPFSSAKQNSMVAYKLIDFKKVDSKSANITYKIDLRDKKNGGYITYQTTYRVSDGRLVDANGDWRNSKRINNLYDTIAALESLMLESLAKENLPDISKTYTKQCLAKKISAVTIDEYKKKLVDQARLIEYCMNFAIVRKAIASNGETLIAKATECKRCKDILGMYNTYSKTVSIAWNPNENADDAIKRLNDLVAAQEVYMSAMELHKTIEAKDAELMAKAATCKNVVKAYSTYFKTADNNWKERTTATELKKALDEIDATQSEFEEAVGSYATLAENNAAIMEKAKVCKNIVKAYSNYISDMEKSFAVTTNPAELNRDISVCIEAQDYIKEAVNSGNAAEFDKKVKALKDKSIDSVLQAIK